MYVHPSHWIVRLSIPILSAIIVLSQYGMTNASVLYQTIPTAAPPTIIILPSPTESAPTVTPAKTVVSTATPLSVVSSEPPPTSTGTPGGAITQIPTLAQSPVATITLTPLSSPSLTPSLTASSIPAARPTLITSRNIFYCLSGIVLLIFLAAIIFWIISSRRKH